MSTSVSSDQDLRSDSRSHSYSTQTADDSSSDESDESHSSTCSTAIDKFSLPAILESAQSGDSFSTLPERLFGTNRYPTKGRVNTYSNLQFLIDIVDILSGSAELETILNSQFGHLLRLPVSRCSLSRKLVHYILCRQVLSANNHDAWFTFGAVPLRFSISEFAFVTRLNCCPIPDHAIRTTSQNQDRKGPLHWNTLIGDNQVVKISEIIKRLRTDTTMPGWKRLQLALVVIVDGIILCNTQPVMASLQVVEMVKDVPFFLTYPWGRHSFYLTLRMMKVGDRVKDRATLVKKLKQKSLVLHGFPLALQLWLFKAIPGLLRYLPHADNDASFLDRSLHKLPRLMTYHTDNISLLENERPVVAFSRICGPAPKYHVDVMHDPCIDFLEKCLDSNKIFQHEDWKGGDISLPPLCLCASAKSGMPTSSTVPTPNPVENNIHQNLVHHPVQSCEKCTNLELQYEDLLEAHTSLKNYMPVFVAAEVDKLRVSFKSEILKTIHETFATKRPDPITETAGHCSQHRLPQYRSSKKTVGGTSKFIRVGLQTVLLNDVSKTTKVQPSHSTTSASTKKVCHFLENDKPHPPSITFRKEASAQPLKIPSPTPTRKRKFTDIPLECTKETRKRARLGPDDTPMTSQPNFEKMSVRPPRIRYEMHSNSTNYDLRGYVPFPVTSHSVVKKFVDMLQTDKDREYTLDGSKVQAELFVRIFTPQKWVLTSHMDLMLRSLWKRRSAYFKSHRMTVMDCYFTQLLSSNFEKFIASDPATFQWPGMLQSYVRGKVPERNDIAPWGEAVDTIYAPMNWADIHWVGLVISLKDWDITVLDPLPTATAKYKLRIYMSYVLNMLPYLVRAFCKTPTGWSPRNGEFTYQVLPHNSANTRTGDCGPLTVKFLELHSHQQSLDRITPDLVDQLRMEYALNVYSDFVGPLP